MSEQSQDQPAVANTEGRRKTERIQQIGRPVNQIEKLAIEIEEYALGVYKEANQADEIIGRAKKIQKLARKRREPWIVGQVAALICYKCDLRMLEDSSSGKYHVFRCPGCDYKVGTLKP